MGLKKRNSDLTYLTINKGEIIMRVKEATDTSVAREITRGDNAGNVVHEEHFDSLEGTLVSIEHSEKEVKWMDDPYETLEILLEDSDGDKFNLSMPFSSGYTRGIMTRIEAIDPSKPIDLRTYWIKGDDGKERGFAGIYQDEEKIEPLYSRGDGQLPDVEVVQVGKKKHYDDSELLDFYIAILDSFNQKFKESANSEEEDDTPEWVTETPEDLEQEETPKRKPSTRGTRTQSKDKKF